MRCAAALALAFAACAAAAEPISPEIPSSAIALAAPRFELEPFRRRFAATPQAEIAAANRFGDLRVRTAARGGLVVSAMVQKIGWREDELEIRIEENFERVLVEVVPRVPRPRGRIDLTLLIPPGKRFAGTTGDGLVEIKYGGDVVARTQSGAITVDGAATADARSESGAVVVRLAGSS